VNALLGLPTDRLRRADETLEELGLTNVSRELLERNDADSVVGALLLAEGLDELMAHGVEETRLLAKLRGDPDVWPTWAELRAASMLARDSPDGARLVFEPDRSRGRHSDYALVWDGGERVSVEFKALGLSDSEAAFCAALGPAVAEIVAQRGLVTIHAPEAQRVLTIPHAERRRVEKDAAKKAKNLPVKAFHQISASIAVARGAEDRYLVRLRQRLIQAIGQLPEAEPSYVAFHWTNGAPSWDIRAALAGADLPDQLSGILLVGSLAVPGSFHQYLQILPAPFSDSPGGGIEVHSETPEVAQTLLEVAEGGGGVRAMVVRVPTTDGWGEFLVRDGSRRILPYNIMWDRDPPGAHDRRTPDLR